MTILKVSQQKLVYKNTYKGHSNKVSCAPWENWRILGMLTNFQGSHSNIAYIQPAYCGLIHAHIVLRVWWYRRRSLCSLQNAGGLEEKLLANSNDLGVTTTLVATLEKNKSHLTLYLYKQQQQQ